MKFATFALLGAFLFTDMIEGRRTRSYEVTRAFCTIDNSEGQDDGLKGRMNMSQVVQLGDPADIRVWSNWVNLPASDTYELALYDAPDCEGTLVDAVNEAGRTSARMSSTGISANFVDQSALTSMGSYSIELSGWIG